MLFRYFVDSLGLLNFRLLLFIRNVSILNKFLTLASKLDGKAQRISKKDQYVTAYHVAPAFHVRFHARSSTQRCVPLDTLSLSLSFSLSLWHVSLSALADRLFHLRESVTWLLGTGLVSRELEEARNEEGRTA